MMLSETDLQLLWRDFDQYEAELNAETQKLIDVKTNIDDIAKTLNEEIKNKINYTEFDYLPNDSIIEFNIGGQLFEVEVSVLTKEPASVLALCCRKDTICRTDQHGKYYFDRDWWLFRLIMSYLRCKVLPSDPEVLRDLHREALFYRLEDLRAAIESIPLYYMSKK